jgi:DNA-binding winged helix-turn-helix (wHTH) protein/Tfp pilus assembly protein PilF
MRSYAVTSEVTFGRFLLSLPQRQLWHDGQPVALKPKEIELLALLAERRPATVLRDEIIDRLWRGSASDAALNQTVYRLRRALGQYDDTEFIRTLPDIGFHLGGGTLVENRNPTPDFLHPRFEVFQRAAVLYARRTEEALLQAIGILEELVSEFPDFVPALVLLAKSYTNAGIRGFVKPNDAYYRARTILESVIEQDPTNVDGFATLSTLLLFFTANRSRARETVERALMLSPQSPVARNAAVWERLSRRDFSAALTQADLAVSSSPSSPHATALVGTVLYMSGMYSQAEKTFATALHLDKNNTTALFYAACAHTMMGNYPQAVELLNRVSGSDISTRVIAIHGILAAKRGDSHAAHASIAALSAMPNPSEISICAVHLANEDMGAAAAALSHAMETREPGLFLATVDPVYGDLWPQAPDIIARIDAGRPIQCDRCGTHLLIRRSSAVHMRELCWNCRS